MSSRPLIPEHLGDRLRLLRTERRLSQRALATCMQEIGFPEIKQPRIVEIEHGLRHITAVELVAFARVLDVPVSELLGVPDYEPPT